MSDGVQVIGGAGGLEAEYSDLLAAAGRLQDAAADLAGIACSSRAVMTDGNLLASTALDPAGAAAVEAAVVAAVAGPHGLLRAAGQLELTSVRLRAAVIRYRTTDELGSGLRQIRQWVVVAGLAVGTPAVLLSGRTATTGPAVEWLTDGHGLRYLTEHPGLAEDVAGGTPSLLQTTAELLTGSGLDLHLGEGAPGHPLFGQALEQAAGLLGAWVVAAFHRGHYAAAAETLAPLCAPLGTITNAFGGSHAQRHVIALTAREATARA